MAHRALYSHASVDITRSRMQGIHQQHFPHIFSLQLHYSWVSFRHVTSSFELFLRSGARPSERNWNHVISTVTKMSPITVRLALRNPNDSMFTHLWAQTVRHRTVWHGQSELLTWRARVCDWGRPCRGLVAPRACRAPRRTRCWSTRRCTSALSETTRPEGLRCGWARK